MFTHIDISHLICRANQVTGFYMMGTLVVKGLKKSQAKRVSDIFKKNSEQILTMTKLVMTVLLSYLSIKRNIFSSAILNFLFISGRSNFPFSCE